MIIHRRTASFQLFAIAFLAFWVGLGLLNCSSGPAVKSAVSTSEGSDDGSLQEGLVVCYQIETPRDATRPRVLKPILDCIDQRVERFPGQLELWMGIFTKEAHTIYAALQDVTWNPLFARELDIAIHAILRSLWRMGLSSSHHDKERFTQEEKRLVIKHFPMTALSLEAGKWKTSQEVSVDLSLEMLKAGIASLVMDPRERQASSTSAETAKHHALLCRKWNQLYSEIGYLSSLWSDQLEMTRLAPQSDESAKVRAKYVARMGKTTKSFRESRADFERAKSETGFRVSPCFSMGRKRNA